MAKASVLSELMEVLVDRRDHPPSDPSYVVTLLDGGVARIGGKIIEEAAEVVEAGDESGEKGRQHLVKEVADLIFHAMVLLAHRRVEWTDVELELSRRFGISGLVEKAQRHPGSKDPSPEN